MEETNEKGDVQKFTWKKFGLLIFGLASIFILQEAGKMYLRKIFPKKSEVTANVSASTSTRESEAMRLHLKTHTFSVSGVGIVSFNFDVNSENEGQIRIQDNETTMLGHFEIVGAKQIRVKGIQVADLNFSTAYDRGVGGLLAMGADGRLTGDLTNGTESHVFILLPNKPIPQTEPTTQPQPTEPETPTETITQPERPVNEFNLTSYLGSRIFYYNDTEEVHFQPENYTSQEKGYGKILIKNGNLSQVGRYTVLDDKQVRIDYLRLQFSYSGDNYHEAIKGTMTVADDGVLSGYLGDGKTGYNHIFKPN